MHQDFDNRLWPEKATLLLAKCKGRIPVKVDSGHASTSRQFFSKATLIGVKGKNGIYVPINGHGGRHETVDMSKIRLWKSRLTPAHFDALTRVQVELDSAVAALPNQYEPNGPETAAQHPPFNGQELAGQSEPPEEVIEAFAGDALEQDAAVPETRPPSMTFKQKVEALKKLQADVEASRSEGIAQLARLREDEAAAKEMLLTVQEEIEDLEALLGFNTPTTTGLLEPTVPKKLRNRAAVQPYRERALEILKSIPSNPWIKTSTLAKQVGWIGKPDRILKVLLQNQVLESQGFRQTREVRLKEQAHA